MERKAAVAVVFHHIGSYHHTRLNAAADRLTVTGIEWSAKAYDAWGAAGSTARDPKVSLFPEATRNHPGKAESLSQRCRRRCIRHDPTPWRSTVGTISDH